MANTENFSIKDLPQGFRTRMEEMLGDEAGAFFASYEKPFRQALRVNTLKCRMTGEDDAFLPEFPDSESYELAPVPWCRTGFYFADGKRPGKSPCHDAGFYYLQEPSAMLVAQLAAVKPGERVLDLCAAPGGKATALAAALDGHGLLVANEIHPARARILSQNIERMGIANAFVTNESPSALSGRFSTFFDKIIVDAPCSGEGMFRKEPAAIECWGPDNIKLCADRQQEILNEAAKMLRPGGKLIYSTCTFAPEEDELGIAAFLESHPDFGIVNAKEALSCAFGDGEALKNALEGLSRGHRGSGAPEGIYQNVFRIWPQNTDGEGHFAAVLEKTGEADTQAAFSKNGSRHPAIKTKAPKTDASMVKLFNDFADNLGIKIPGYNAPAANVVADEMTPVLISYGENLYLAPCNLDLSGLKCLRPGLQLGEIIKDRFEPSHALALALRNESSGAEQSPGAESVALSGPVISPASCVDIDLISAAKVIAGESLPISPDLKGWKLITLGGCGLAFGKAAGGQLKNHYPKGLRHQ